MNEHFKPRVEELEPLNLLEAKMRDIEMKVFGAVQSSEKFVNSSDMGDLADVLMKSHTIMSTAISSQEKISKMVKRLDDLNTVLNPSFECIVLHDAAKIETLLLMYDQLHEAAVRLKLVKESSGLLNDEQMRGVLKSEDRVNTLFNTMYDNKSKVEANTEEVRHLLTEYNTLINTFSSMFTQLNDVVTALEIENEPKAVRD